MGYESSPGCQRQGIPLSLQYDCLLLLVLNSLSCEEPTPIQPLPTTLIKKLSKTHARQSVFSGILLLVLFWGVTMLKKQASLLWWLSSKESACSAGGLCSIPGSERSPGEVNGNSLQYSCLENLMDGGAWWTIVHGVAKSWTQLSDFTSLTTECGRNKVA